MSMLEFGSNSTSIKAATEAICTVIKAAAGNETIVSAAMNALAQIARAPAAINVSHCTFTQREAPKRKAR
jgi:seryl-tRNA(Sec) selenium transferase